MLDTILEQLKKLLKSRLFPIYLIYSVLIFLLIQKLFSIQIANPTVTGTVEEDQTEQTMQLSATRGNFYDCNGELLAYNKLCYNITISDTNTLDSAQKNAMILHLLQILEKNQAQLQVSFYIEQAEDGSFHFTVDGSKLLRFRKDAYSTENLTETQLNASAEDIYRFLRYDTSTESPDFNITSDYSDADALKILAVRFALFEIRYQTTLPKSVTVAGDVSSEVVAAIKENSAELPGVEVTESTKRYYNYSECMASILGYTGAVTDDELEEMQSKGDTFYSSGDQIGRTGLEQVYEEYLRGVKGSEVVEVNDQGEISSIKSRNESTAGNDVYLSIDAKLQESYYKLLERRIAGILLAKIHSGTSHGSKGTSASDILIPIDDVYYAILNNNIVDVTKFDDADADSLEKSIYEKYLSRRDTVTKKIRKYLAADSTATDSSVSDAMAEYLDHVYEILTDNNVIYKDKIDTSDSTYKEYRNDKISLSSFLQYCIAKEWVNLNVLEIGSSFYSNEQIYGKLLDYSMSLMDQDTDYAKMIYSELVYGGTISGQEICRLIYAQGVLKEDADLTALENGTMSSYNWIRKKIKNLEITPAMLGLEPCSGSIVATDPNTGKVIALVSYPGYDNNKLANTIDSTYYSSLLDNTSLPLVNRATQTRIAPGSTYKMMTATTALETGVLSSPTATVTDRSQFTKVKPSPKCWIYPSSHGTINVSEALEVSCNYFFYEMGYRLGLKGGSYVSDYGLSRLAKYAAMYGFDAKTGIEIGEYDPQISTTDAVRSAIGQGSNAYAPIQMSRYVCAVANSGTAYDLTLLDCIKDVSGNVVLQKKSVVHSKVEARQSTWDAIHKGNYLVVNGPRSSIRALFSQFRDANISISGKTGTAQQNTYHPNHAWFVSYAPSDNPKISIVVMIPNGYTSSNAAELASYCYQVYFKLGNYNKLVNGKATLPRSGTGRTD